MEELKKDAEVWDKIFSATEDEEEATVAENMEVSIEQI
jgi:hypothetical protein